MPIRWRLALLFMLATGLVGLGGGTFYVLRLRASALATVDGVLRSRADPVVQALRGGSVEIQDLGPTSLVAPADRLVQILAPGGSVADGSPGLGPLPLVDPRSLPAATSTMSRRVDRLGDARVLAVPVVRADGTWTVLAATSLESTNAAIGHARDALLVGALPVVLVAGAGAWAITGAALRPVERMRRQAAEISATDSAARLEVPRTRDEIAALARTVNDLLSRLHAALGRQRDFIADASHELRTPLAVLQGELELAGHPSRTRAELQAAVAAAFDEAARLGRLAHDLLTLARVDGGRVDLRPAVVSVADMLARQADVVRAAAHPAPVTVTTDAPAGLRVTADPDRIRQALDNLTANALAYSPTPATIELAARRAGDSIEIDVRDHGPGFPPEFLPHAFERFRRPDAVRNRDHGGTGLGLSIVAAITDAHGGSAYARNHPGGGAVVGLRLPACDV